LCLRVFVLYRLQMFSKSQSHFYLLVHIRRPKKTGFVSKSKPQIPELTKLVFVNLTGRCVLAYSLVVVGLLVCMPALLRRCINRDVAIFSFKSPSLVESWLIAFSRLCVLCACSERADAHRMSRMSFSGSTKASQSLVALDRVLCAVRASCSSCLAVWAWRSACRLARVCASLRILLFCGCSIASFFVDAHSRSALKFSTCCLVDCVTLR
jgi:hypothetical protein